MANTITLSFAGDTTGVQQSFDRVGSAARDMGTEVDRTGASFDRVAEGADNVDTKAMGFRDTLTGIQDGAEGIKLAASGEWGFETLLLLGFGIGDLASGLFNFLIPAIKSTTLAIKGMSLAMLTSPITWIILGIVALVAAFVILWRKSEAFRNFWKGAWQVIKTSAVAAWDWIKSKGASVVEWLRKIPGWLRSSFSKVADFLTAPFRSSFNAIARLWNNTIGRLSWTVPGWVPGIGGNSISVPNLPTFHAGGRVPGAPGQVVPILAMAGEEVSATGGRSGGEQWVRVDLGELGDALLPVIARAVDRRGGRVTALGVKVTGGAIRV